MGIAIAVGVSGAMSTSPDGINWTARTSGFGTTTINDVTWSPTLGLFVAVGASGAMSTSPDGINWTARTSSFDGTTTINGVTWSPTLGLFVAVGASGKTARSPDGINWTQNAVSGTFNDVTWSPTLGLFVAVGGSVVYTSVDGVTWVAGTGVAITANDVAWSPTAGVFVIVGNSGNVYTSPDGFAWTARSTGIGSSLNNIAWSPTPGLFVAVGASGTVLTSPTGTTWTVRSSDLGSSVVNAVDWAPTLGLFVAVGVAGAMSTSPDGINWTARTSSFGTTTINGVTGDTAPVVTRTGIVIAAAGASALAMELEPRLGTITTGPVLSAARVLAQTRTADLVAAPALTAVADVENFIRIRTGNVTPVPVLTAVVVTQITRTATATAAPVLTATQTNQISPQRPGTATAAPALSATGRVTQVRTTGTVSFPNPVASSTSSFGLAIPPGPPLTGQVDLRLRAYAPNGANRGLLPSPDDFQAAIPLNDVPSLTMTYGVVAPLSRLLGQPIELALEVSEDQGATWVEPDDCRFLYLTDGRDPAKTADTWAAEAKGYVWRLTKARVLASGLLNGEGRREFSGVTAGGILATLWAEAQTRGALEGMTLSGSAAVDAAGVTWPSPLLNRVYDVGTDYLTVLLDLAAAGAIDFRMTGRTLKLYKPNTVLAVDRTVTPTQIHLTPLQITEAPFRRTWEGLADFIQATGDEGASASWTGAGLKPWGRWEDFISQGGVTDTTLLAFLAAQYSTLTSAERAEYTQGLALTGYGPVPLADFSPGDYVWSRALDGSIARYRVRQVTLQKDGNSVQGNVVLNDRFLEQDIRTQRWIDSLTNGASGAGSSGGIPTPVGPDILQPAAPTGLTGSSATYLDEAGVTWANVSLDWADVTTNADGSPITDLDHYQVQAKQGATGSTSQWQELTRVAESRAFIANYVPLSVWTYRVRAVDTSDNRSAWTPLFQVTMVADNTGPGQPSTPASVSRLGIGKITWDGLNAAAGPMDADFHHVDIHLSLTNGFAYSAATKVNDLPGAGSAVATGLTYGAMYYGRLVPYDTSGNAGTPSNQFAMSVAALVDVSNFPDSAMIDLYARTGHFLTVETNQINANGGAIGYLETGVIVGGVFETSAGGEFRTNSDPSTLGGVRVRGTDGFKAWASGGGTPTVSIDPSTGLLTAIGGSFVSVTMTGGIFQSAAPGSARMEISGTLIQWKTAAGAITSSLRQDASGPLLAADALGYAVGFVSGVGFQVNGPAKVTADLLVGGNMKVTTGDIGWTGTVPTVAALPNIAVGASGNLGKANAANTLSTGAVDSGGTGFRMVRVPN